MLHSCDVSDVYPGDRGFREADSQRATLQKKYQVVVQPPEELREGHPHKGNGKDPTHEADRDQSPEQDTADQN